jgi:hypothetical protein
MNTMSTEDRHTTLQILRVVLVGVATTFYVALGSHAADEPVVIPRSTVDFERHVAPLFGRLGCNAAACHGAFGGGRGGLQLSLFGYSPKMDYRAVEDRSDRSDAEASLLLLKPSGLEPHEGGVRLNLNSESYRTIRRWIEQRARWEEGSGRVKSLKVDPPQVVFDNSSASTSAASQSLAVTAEFADGSRAVRFGRWLIGPPIANSAGSVRMMGRREG